MRTEALSKRLLCASKNLIARVRMLNDPVGSSIILSILLTLDASCNIADCIFDANHCLCKKEGIEAGDKSTLCAHALDNREFRDVVFTWSDHVFNYTRCCSPF
mmetsp:Transcript_49978/g.156436  ORF Transcript_49978/g.156436 Transcript_49978/m.156436 type:complete len:103 (-) Transcript_49978:313-621(-)